MTIRETLIILFAVIVSGITQAGVDGDTNEKSVILAGFDPVAYFTENAAVQGSADFSAVHDGAIYYFSSVDNRDMFKTDPSKFEPQYGGFCAYGAALGKKVPVDGKAFEIVDGKLYVNKNLAVQDAWAEEKIENIAEADAQWTQIEDVAAADL